MKNKFLISFTVSFLGCMLLCVSSNVLHAQTYPYQDKPLVNPDPSPEAVALFRYLQDMYGKKILSGQMWAPWGVNEINYVFENTGRKPAIAGFDFIHEAANSTEVQRAKNYWNSGGIPTIMWHWGAPAVGEGYENSKATIDINQCFIEGTPEYNSMWSELEIKANRLEALRDANIPVLWRPFHELNGGWFWWGKQGPELFKQLWITMYDYFVNVRGLNNLIWVFCYANPPAASWYPGDAWVDIAGSDTYDGGDGSHLTMYNAVKAIVDHNPMPIAYHECGIPPHPDQCRDQGALWSWWMQWHTSWLTDTDTDYLEEVYNHELVITLDEVPDIMATYGWGEGCAADSITMNNKIDNGNWRTVNSAPVHLGSSVLLSPAVESDGSWLWSGAGLSGTGREQTISRETGTTAAVTFTNSCGATSTAVFNVTGDCFPSLITPYLAVFGGIWQLTDTVTISPGTEVYLDPQPANGGTWSWSGPDLESTSRSVLVTPEETATYTASYTNPCGAISTQDFIITVKLDSLNGIMNPGQKIFNVYPTLFKDKLHVELNQDGWMYDTGVEVFSAEGRKLFSESYKSNNFEINTSSIRNGIYLLRLTNGSFSTVKRIIKI